MEMKKKGISFLGGLVIALSTSITSTSVMADHDYEVGPPLCTGIGCYQLVCNDSGCSLVFTPRDPFEPKEQVN